MNAHYSQVSYGESSTDVMHAVSLQLHSAIMTASTLLEQPPPPSVREILAAYSTRGDGDREMLLAMLNAKSAEDQRLASVANLQKGLLDVYHSTSHGSQTELERERASQSNPMRTPESPPASLSRTRDAHSRHHPYRYAPTSDRRGRSPHAKPTDRELHTFQDVERRRRAPAPSPIDVPRHSSRGQAPLSPRTSSSRSNSSEGSPRASPRSMAIDNLLTSAPLNASSDDQKPILTSSHPAIVRAT
ncbi:hypothetical protein K523DRAFT_268700 [Schizophyllum commune Tattone D]|nr:hypothetical protein K523DRAFT_268700 [Schizophyllum commune Tattone D]